MATASKRKVKSLFADKEALREIIDRVNAEMGIIPDPTATAEKAQQMTAENLRAKGCAPEDNLASLEIIAERERKSGDGHLAIVLNPEIKRLFADKQALKMILAEQNKDGKLAPASKLTAQELRQKMIAEGLDPTSNAGSREIIAMREE